MQATRAAEAAYKLPWWDGKGGKHDGKAPNIKDPEGKATVRELFPWVVVDAKSSKKRVKKAPLAVVYVHGYRGGPLDISPIHEDLVEHLKNLYGVDRLPFVCARLRYHGYVGSASLLQIWNVADFVEDAAHAVVYAKKFL